MCTWWLSHYLAERQILKHWGSYLDIMTRYNVPFVCHVTTKFKLRSMVWRHHQHRRQSTNLMSHFDVYNFLVSTRRFSGGFRGTWINSNATRHCETLKELPRAFKISFVACFWMYAGQYTACATRKCTMKSR